jgi:HAD superfamily hydrolase (TIGR01549 family)
MCYPWSLAQAASELEIALSPAELQELEAQLLDETASIELYEETREVLTGLRSLGYRIAVCSNLALPYADPIEALVGDLLDIRVWSFQAGAIKPSPQIYERLLEQTGHTAAETLMVGDSLSSDYEGARAAGLSALHLVRDTVPVHDTQIRSLTEVLNVA